MTAFEAARYLLRNGHQVQGVLLIDSPSPLNHIQLSEDLIDCVVDSDRGHRVCSEARQLVKSQFKMNSHALANYNPHTHKGSFPSLALLRSSEGFHHPDIKDIPAWLSDRSNPDQVVLDWEKLVGTTVKVWKMPGHHFRPFDDVNVSLLASYLL